MSTSINLLDPKMAPAADGKPSSKKGTTTTKAAADGGEGGGSSKPAAPVPPALQPFHPLIQRFMASHGFAEPTPIQARCWPACCAGRDVLGVAEPGSGKTLAYLLPGAVAVTTSDSGSAAPPLAPAGGSASQPRLLVLTPTRELALQVAKQAKDLRLASGLRRYLSER